MALVLSTLLSWVQRGLQAPRRLSVLWLELWLGSASGPWRLRDQLQGFLH